MQRRNEAFKVVPDRGNLFRRRNLLPVIVAAAGVVAIVAHETRYNFCVGRRGTAQEFADLFGPLIRRARARDAWKLRRAISRQCQDWLTQEGASNPIVPWMVITSDDLAMNSRDDAKGDTSETPG